jgi:RNA polymerase sigma factor (sigma-70 family)
MRSRSDHALVRATAHGDEAAFAALVARHRPRLVRYATSRCGRDGALAEDAVQDALVRAHRAILAGKVPVDVEAWLYAIVRNRCHDYFRAARPTAPLPPELPGGAPSAFEVVERAERLAGALDAVDALPSAQRAALVGRELEGRSYEELAVRQQTSVSAVKSLLHRARVTLAHGASLPAFAVPFFARLPRLRVGQAFGGLIAEQTTGAAAIATIALAGTSALGSLHVPEPPAGPTAAQSRSALVTAAHRPRVAPPVPKAKRKDPLDAEYGPAASGTIEYGSP